MDSDQDDIALFVAMPARHLEAAASLGVDRLILPLGRLGDVATAPPGCPVYYVTLDDDGIGSPAATWRARLVGWHEPDADFDPQRTSDPLPPSWLEERAAERSSDASTAEDETSGADGAIAADDENEDEDDEEDGDPERPRQVLVVVEDLRPLDREDWIFGNEVVPKQRRGSRSFVPMTPTLVRLPD